MANRYRGEIAATLDGVAHTLCLTLGALAELEGAFGSDDMLALASRFGSGRISATDCARIIGAGLRGGGHDITDDAVCRMRGEDGAAGYVDVVARLLAATFGGPIAAAAVTANAAPAPMAKADAPDDAPSRPTIDPEPEPPRPFPGPR